MLAASRVWAVFSCFFPYKELMHEDWDAVVREFIPRMKHVRDALECHPAIAEMTARTHGTHIDARSQASWRMRQRRGAGIAGGEVIGSVGSDPCADILGDASRVA